MSGMASDLTHGSLFSGIGGFEKGGELAGIKTLWSCEVEEYQRKVLTRNFDNNEQYTDITTTNIKRQVDIISGGFPCQDISIAGSMEGINGSKSGLWSEMFRIVGDLRPSYVIIENSLMLLIRGFEKVLCDLSSIGYHAEWQCISNASFGYPHTRKRLYVIAYTNQIRSQRKICQNGSFESIFRKWSSNTTYGYSLSKGIYAFPESSTVRNGDGFRYWTQRVGSIGNAVNPTLAYYLFECIKRNEIMINNYKILP